MSRSFDYETFLKRSGDILVQSEGKTFHQLAKEIEALGQEYDDVRDKAARIFIRRQLARRLHMFATDTSQPIAVVDRLYKRTLRLGFNDLHAEVASAIEYADYCRRRRNPAKGLEALYKARERISARQGIVPDNIPNFLQPIEASINRLEKKNK